MRPAAGWNATGIAAGLVLGAALLAAGSAWAQSAGTTIAGPFTVTLPSTSTFSFSTGFRVPIPIQGSYILRVQLNTANSLTAASLKLNGAQIFSLSDFSGGVTSVDKVVTLLASDTIALSVAGAKGTKITITVFTVVMPKPVSLGPNPLSLNIGGSGTLTATLAPMPTAAGTLSVANNNPAVASVPASVGFGPGQTSVAIAVTALSGGSTTVTVSANGGQASATVAVDTPPSINLTSPAANSVFPAPATILLSASAADSDGTVARVDFYQGGTLIGSAPSAPYNFTWTSVGGGSYTLTAVATDSQGSSTASAAVTIRVNAPPTVGLTSPTTGASFTAPATIQLIANASDSDGTIARVDFFQGTTPIGSATTAPYAFSWTNVAQGAYALTAVATDNDGAVTTSIVVNVTVSSGIAQMYYIDPDHQNTARLIQDQAGNTVWRWDQGEPFGNDAPNNNPSGAGAFEFNLRFPGQYFDRETNLVYNWVRDYDPNSGRYVEAEPLGLAGDINLYRYARNNTLSITDPDGQAPVQIPGGSASGGISGAIPVLGPLSIGGGTGITIRRCCSRTGKVNNEWLWTARFGVGVGFSFQPTASGRGTIPLIQIGGLPRCSPPVTDTFLGSIDVSIGPFSGRVNFRDGILSGGLSPGGRGGSGILNLFERTVVIDQKETGECCTPN